MYFECTGNLLLTAKKEERNERCLIRSAFISQPVSFQKLPAIQWLRAGPLLAVRR